MEFIDMKVISTKLDAKEQDIKVTTKLEDEDGNKLTIVKLYNKKFEQVDLMIGDSVDITINNVGRKKLYRQEQLK